VDLRSSFAGFHLIDKPTTQKWASRGAPWDDMTSLTALNGGHVQNLLRATVPFLNAQQADRISRTTRLILHRSHLQR